MQPVHSVEIVAVAVNAVILVAVAVRVQAVRAGFASVGPFYSRVQAVVARVPTAVGVSAIVSLAAGFRILLVAPKTIPTVLDDELIYTGLAKGFALHWEPLFRGRVVVGESLLYPLFASFAYRFAADGASAFAALKVMNATAMALAAIPAYLLARRVVSRGWGLAVAALTVAAPWTEYAALTMTESLFYPLFVVFVLVFVLMVERPTIARQLLTIAMLAILTAVRPQALVLAGSVVAVVVTDALMSAAPRVAIVRYRPTFGVFALVGVIAAGGSVAHVPLPTSAYHTLFTIAYNPVTVVKWGLWNLGGFELALGFVAFSAFPVALVWLLGRRASSSERAFGLAALAVFAGILLSVALLSASPYGFGILHERNFFYVTPILLVCAAHWASRGFRGSVWVTALAGLGSIGLVALVPRRLFEATNGVDSPTAAFFRDLRDHLPGVSMRVWPWAVAVLGLCAFFLVRRSVALLVSVVLAFAILTAETQYGGPLSPQQDRALAWVDRALPHGAEAALVSLAVPTDPSAACAEAAGLEQQQLLVWTEFFNTRVGNVVDLGQPATASSRFHVGAGGVVLDAERPLHERYVVIDSRQPLIGARLVRFDLDKLGSPNQNGASLSLWRADDPVRLARAPTPVPARADGRNC
jgi:hypothetical protein